MDNNIIFAAEDEAPNLGPFAQPWLVYMVDDDEGIHEASKLALRSRQFSNRPIAFTSFFCAEEFKKISHDLQEPAVMILDVVMETDTAGLDLVNFVRHDLDWQSTRILLRTGQPGYAPEQEILEKYDINDYLLKTESSKGRLVTMLHTAVKSYQHIVALNASRKGLEKIVRATPKLLESDGVFTLSEGVLEQIAGLLSVTVEGIVCMHRHPDMDEKWTVIGATGSCSNLKMRQLGAEDLKQVQKFLPRILEHKKPIFEEGVSCFFVEVENAEILIYVNSFKRLTAEEEQLLNLFAINFAAYFKVAEWKKNQQ